MMHSIEQMEQILRRNLDQRRMAGVVLRDQLLNAAHDLNNSHSVLIVTGFCIKACGIGETDGPLGALSLAHALNKLHKKVAIVTDPYSVTLLRRGMEGLNLTVDIVELALDAAPSAYEQIMDRYRPDHVIAIERPGRAADGKPYSMRGEDISDVSANTDVLFHIAKARGIRTSAVGDGGNEIGMGRIKEYVYAHVPRGETICAQLCTDHLILAGVSNWGGHALGAALSVMNNRMLMYDALTEADILRRMVLAGAVDGCTFERNMTVDGLSFEENIGVFRALRDLAENALILERIG